MENIILCRLCLNVTKNRTWNLSKDCDIICKIRSCFNLDLTLDEVLPDHLCQKCVNKIEEINKFRLMIKENEERLQQHLLNGSLTDYFMNFMKEETNVQHSLEVQSNIKLEDTIDNRLTGIKENTSNSVKEVNASEVIKEEIVNYDLNETYCSSEEEDNVTLSLLKDEKINVNKSESEISIDLSKSKENLIDEQFNCLMCDTMCESRNKLREHYKLLHAMKSDDVVKPKYTEIVINNKVMYKCNSCEKIYAKKFIKRHTYYHTSERPYVCKLCARTYKTVSDIMRHGFRAHSGQKLLCSYKCGFSTAYTGALKEHENKLHKNLFKYTCDKCGKGFTVKTWFEQHQNVHSGLKPFVCDVCGVAFHMDKYLTSHRSAMHPQSLSKKPLICLHCDLKCDSVNTLALHLENEHGITKGRSKYMKKKTLCDFCGKILNRPEQLVLHRRMHLGEKPYKCSICNKAFPRKFSMQVHERAHSRERAHACTQCGKLYSQPSALYRHQRLHHGVTRKRDW